MHRNIILLLVIRGIICTHVGIIIYTYIFNRYTNPHERALWTICIFNNSDTHTQRTFV